MLQGGYPLSPSLAAWCRVTGYPLDDQPAPYSLPRPSVMESDDLLIKYPDAHSLLRPETVEALYFVHRATRNETYREWGWGIFRSLVYHAKIESGGFASRDNVFESEPSSNQFRKMESFFLAETLKYLYLLFGGGELGGVPPLDQLVFNTGE